MNIICNALIMLTLSFVIIKEYVVLQSFHYELSKYFYHIKNHRKKYFYFLYFLLALFVLKADIFYCLLTGVLFIYLARDHKLIYTNRVKRVLVINAFLLTVFLLFDCLRYVFIVPFLYLLLVHCVSLFIEKIVYLQFLKKAKRKIINKYVIGISGSCGKTSVKNIVYDMLVNELNVTKTPKSFNNKMGILKSINEYVNDFDDYFVCEYGVDKVGGMDKLLKIVRPNIAILTEIGNQHLLSFKTVENILNEKMKLVLSLKDGGIAVINNDNNYLREYNYKNINVLRYGIKNDSDVMAKNVVLHSNGSEFDLYIKNKYISRVTTSLLSIHSVENILCSICVCLYLKIDIERILVNIKNISNIPHRLELKFIDGIEVIDDSFNSNYKGFMEALEILSYSDKYKIIVTPGIIEQGDNNKQISYEIGKRIIECCDYVYLVSENSKYIKEYFNEVGFDKFQMYDFFVDAFAKAKKETQEKIILIENDLPDIYLN